MKEHAGAVVQRAADGGKDEITYAATTTPMKMASGFMSQTTLVNAAPISAPIVDKNLLTSFLCQRALPLHKGRFHGERVGV